MNRKGRAPRSSLRRSRATAGIAGATIALVALTSSSASAAATSGNLDGWGTYAGSAPILQSPSQEALPGNVAVSAIAAGFDNGYAIGSDGGLYSWGDNTYGQLGNGTIAPTFTADPARISLPDGVTPTQISSTHLSAYAIGSDGNIYSWGYSRDGDLGNGTEGPNLGTPQGISLAPGAVPPVTARSVAAGLNGAYAIGSDGNLYAWGGNSNGELGDGTNTEHDRPEVITLAPGVKPTAIASNNDSAYAIGTDGNLYAWGFNVDGELGDGTTTSSDHPEKITLAPGVSPTSVVGAGYDSYGSAYAIGSDGNLYAWGDDLENELGDGNDVDQLTPERIVLASGVTPKSIAANHQSGYAIGSDGNLYGWGDDFYNEMGDGTQVNRATPGVISLGSGVTPLLIGAGGGRAYAIVPLPGAPTDLPEVPYPAVLIATFGAAIGALTFSRSRRRRPVLQ